MEKIVKHLLLLFLLNLLLSSTLVIQAQGDVLNQAVTACTNGDYAAAIAIFETAVKGGARDANLFYDLGVCYAGAGQPGQALVNVLRAARTLPRDAAVNTQLDRLRVERADLPEDETDLVTLIAGSTGRLVTLTELASLALISWISFFAVLIVYRLRPTWQTALRIASITAAIVLAALLILMGSRVYIDHSRPAGVIIADPVRAMSGPGDDYLPLFALSEAAEIRILETREGWHRVALPGGRQGWIRQETVVKVNP